MNEQKNLFSAECLDCTETADLRPSEITDTGRACPGITRSTEQSQVLEEGGLTNAFFFYKTPNKKKREAVKQSKIILSKEIKKEEGRKPLLLSFAPKSFEKQTKPTTTTTHKRT